jgi:two-component sensor histidine kinase
MVARLERTDNLVRPRDFVDVLGSKWAFLPSTIWFYAAATFVPATASELGRLENPSLLVAVGLAALSVGIAAVLLFIVKFALPRRLRESPLIVIVVLAGIGYSRGTIMAAIVEALDVESRSFALTRGFVSAASLPVVLALVALVISRLTTSRQLRESTRNDISEAVRTRDRVLAEVSSSGERLVDEVDGKLRPAVSAIVSQVEAGRRTRTELADSIDALVANVIRPLSHALATTGTAFPASRSAAQRLVAATSGPKVTEQFSPTFTGLGSFLGTGSVLLDTLPFRTAFLAALSVGVLTYTVLRVASLILGERRVHNLAAIAIVSTLHAVAWIPSHLVNASVVFPPDFFFNPWIIGVVGSILLGSLFQLIVLGAYSSRNQLVRLENARVDMVLQLSEARRRAWLRQRHLTHTLHSTVQSRVHAEARLVRSGTGTLTASERRRVTETVRSVLESVNEEPPAAVDAVRGIRDTIAFWSGMCDISLDISPDAERAIAADAEVAEAIHIVTLEILSNAIRHGQATEVHVAIRRESPETVRITATNNGEAVVPDVTAGLGMALYDELCVQWEIRSENRVTIDALIAARGNNRSEYAI